MKRAWRYLRFLVLIPLLFVFPLSAAYTQTDTQVAIRPPGARLLGAPDHGAQEARNDLDFARLSDLAYRRKPDAKPEFGGEGSCPAPEAALIQAGWKPWPSFLEEKLRAEIDDAHLRVEVWKRESDPAVAVAFGGTVFTNPKDWLANLRWFVWRHDDEYTKIVKIFAPEFAKEFARRRHDPHWGFLNSAKVFSTGHSLGGGLAQQFAYALPDIPGVTRVTKVYAFDPSPVTGFYSLDVATRERNSKGLSIDRIYERGEILAIVRAITAFFYRPSTEDPTIRGIRFALFRGNLISGHSMPQLACRLNALAQRPPG